MFKWFRKKSNSSFEEVIAAISDDVSVKASGWTKRSYRGYAHEAYEKNVVAYSCVNNISKAVAGIPIIIKVNDKEITSGKLYDLIHRPNPTQSYKAFMRLACMYRLISGNTYIYNLRVSTKRIMQMDLLRPDRVRILFIRENEPYAYEYTIAGIVYQYPIDPNTQLSDVLHLKEPNPLCDLYGLSPIGSSIISVEQHNSAVAWNKALLDNGARPPGVLSLVNRNDAAPSPTQATLDDISARLNEKYAGYKNAGKIPVLGFDMEWRNMGMSPTDMDWLNGKNSSARDVCLALGYPAHLLGQTEGSTFNNVSEAKLSLYEDTVIPLAESMYSEIAYYIRKQQGDAIEIVPDLDKVSALTPRREAARKNARDDLTAGVITTNEARAEGHYDEITGGDDVLVPAGKLPINFDMNDMTKQQYSVWLVKQGLDEGSATKMANLAYNANSH